MKGLKKIALVSAIAAAPFAANAELVAMEDEFLGDITGQDGIIIDLDLAVSIGEIQYIDKAADPADANGVIRIQNLAVGNLDRAAFDADGTIAFDAAGSQADVTLTIDVLDSASSELVTAPSFAAEADDIVQIGLDIGTLDVAIGAVTFGDNSIGTVFIDNIDTSISAAEVTAINSAFGDIFDAGVTDVTFNNSVLVGASAEETILVDVAFGANIDSLTYSQRADQADRGDITIEGISLFDGVDTDGDGDFDQINPLSITGLEIRATDAGLQISGLAINGEIAIQDIRLGANSIGSVLISDLDLQETTITISGKP